MTTHYGDTVTAKEIVWEWKRNGCAIPGAYGIFSAGDETAFGCWIYLEKKQKDPNFKSVEEFCSQLLYLKEERIAILKEVLEILDPPIT